MGKSSGIEWWIAPALGVAALSITVPVSLFVADLQGTDLLYSGLLMGVVALAVAAVEAFSVHRQHPGAIERRIMLLLKLGLLPFMVSGVICLLLTLGFSLVSPVVLAFSALIFAGCSFVALLGSVWIFLYASTVRHRAPGNNGLCVAMIVFGCIPVLDVVAAVVLFAVGRRCGL